MTKLKDSISYQLLFNVILIYVIVTVVITSIHMLVDLQYQKEYVRQELQTIAKATNKSILNSVWEINQKQLQTEVNGIMKLPIVKALQVIDKENSIIIEKRATSCNNCTNSAYMHPYKLYKKIFNKNVYLGEVRLFSNNDTAVQRLKTNFSFIILSSLIKSALLIILFVLAFKRYLQRPLTHIVSQIDTINLNKRQQRIEYDNNKEDELVVLKNSVNKMLGKIDDQVAKLQESETLLQKKVEDRTQDLNHANEQLQSVIKGSNLGFWDWNIQNNAFEVNERWLDILDLKKEDVKDKSHWHALILEEDRDKIIPMVEHAIENNKMFTIEYRMRHKKGHYVWIEASGSLIQQDNEHNPLRACGTHKDITQRKKSDIEVIQQKNFLNTLIKNAPNPIFYKNIEGKYLGVNDAWVNMIGIKNEEIIGKSVFDIAPEKVAREYKEQDEQVFKLKQNPQIYKSVVINKATQKKYHVMFYKSAFFDENNNVIGLIGSILDLTEINRLQDEKIRQEKLLFEQSKLASMGEMIGNIAHQWRQPLSIISTYATGLEMHRSMNILSDELITESAQKINENAQYLSNTIDDFKSFIKGDDTLISFNIKEIIESFRSLVNPMVKQYRINMIIDIDDDIMIHGYPNQLIQCFMNFFNNSKDAFMEREEKYFFIHEYKDKETIIITFKDNAGGIEESIMNKIFEPYFTTKHQSQGTGLGLHMTYKLITDGMHGHIEVKNVDYEYNNKSLRGAEFKITLSV